MRRQIDVKALFKKLNALEYRIIKYLNNDHGTEPDWLNYKAMSEELGAGKTAVRSACRRLILSGVLIAEGKQQFKLSEDIFKDR